MVFENIVVIVFQSFLYLEMNKNTIFLLFFLIIFDINPLKQSINIKKIILNKKNQIFKHFQTYSQTVFNG
jgi:hypothetical protein